ncbi:MAG: endonuclease/exonuclease/phosphatase family protein [Pseudomonadales bacterium]|nr:endonuclease/exonuclease/phosphatase family protein [Pseudomonadales bacterium]
MPARLLLPADALWVDVLSSFALQGALLALVAAGVLAWRGRRLRALAFLLLLLPDALTELSAARARSDVVRPLGRVYAANLGQSPAAVIAAAAQLEELAPDLVWLSEFPEVLDPEARSAFARVEEAYAYGLAWPAAEGRSLRFLSRYPLRAREEFNADQAPGRPALHLLLDVDGIPLVVVALHTHPPSAHWALGARNEVLDWAAEVAAAARGDVLLLGDLNTSAFSPRFDRLVRRSGLDCASPLSCSVPSWPAQLPLLLTPIDHVLAGGELVVTRRMRGATTGSDHYPVIADLARRARK